MKNCCTTPSLWPGTQLFFGALALYLGQQLWTFYIITTLCHVNKRGIATEPLPSSTFNVVIEWSLVADRQSHAIHGEKAIQFKVPGEPGSSGAVERSRECRPNYNKFTVVEF